MRALSAVPMAFKIDDVFKDLLGGLPADLARLIRFLRTDGTFQRTPRIYAPTIKSLISLIRNVGIAHPNDYYSKLMEMKDCKRPLHDVDLLNLVSKAENFKGRLVM